MFCRYVHGQPQRQAASIKAPDETKFAIPKTVPWYDRCVYRCKTDGCLKLFYQKFAINTHTKRCPRLFGTGRRAEKETLSAPVFTCAECGANVPHSRDPIEGHLRRVHGLQLSDYGERHVAKSSDHTADVTARNGKQREGIGTGEQAKVEAEKQVDDRATENDVDEPSDFSVPAKVAKRDGKEVKNVAPEKHFKGHSQKDKEIKVSAASGATPAWYDGCRYECSQCPFQAKSIQSAAQHAKALHGLGADSLRRTETSWECPLCKLAMNRNKLQIGNHLARRHKGITLAEYEKRLVRLK